MKCTFLVLDLHGPAETKRSCHETGLSPLDSHLGRLARILEVGELDLDVVFFARGDVADALFLDGTRAVEGATVRLLLLISVVDDQLTIDKESR